MGREIKRVALDFDTPIGTVWQGFLMPERLHEAPCPAVDVDCFNGFTASRAWVHSVAYLLLMLDDDRRDQERGRPMHPYFHSLEIHPHYSREWYEQHGLFTRTLPRPGADIVAFGTGLAGREGGWLGHDGCDQWTAEKSVIRAAGLDPDTWGICQKCGGRASVEAYSGQREEAEAWEPQEPPVGDGWQLWETVSEGSPVGPVFATAEELARWLGTDEGGSAVGFGRTCTPMPYESALAFVTAGWAPSLIGNAGGLHDGAAFIGSEAVLSAHEDGA